MTTIDSTEKQGKPEIALVFGPGITAGFHALGAVKRVYEAGLQPTMVIGSSVGSYLGPILAANRPDLIDEIAQQITYEAATPKNLKHNYGLFGMDPGMRIMRKYFGSYQRLEDFPVRFVNVATDAETRRPTVFSEGEFWPRNMGSLAHPIFYQFIKIDGRYYTDGGISNPAPVDVAYQLGADYTIFVDPVSISPRPLTPSPAPLSRAKRLILSLVPGGLPFVVASTILRIQETVASLDMTITAFQNNLIAEKVDRYPPTVYMKMCDALNGDSMIPMSKVGFADRMQHVQRGYEAAAIYVPALEELKARISSAP